MPQGYEVFEAPENAQVYLRKVQDSPIAEFEREVVADGIRRLAGLEHFIVVIEDDCLIVYLPAMESKEVDDLIRVLAGPSVLQSQRMQGARKHLFTCSKYDKMLRFRLVDSEKRKFTIERRCFLGSIDNWMMLCAPASDLPDLVEEFVGHLGTEEFFELF